MRTRHWLSGTMSAVLALAGADHASAQYGPDPMAGMPAGSVYSPYGGVAGYGEMQPGYPPGYMAYPNVSPYMSPPVDQTYVDDGFWFNRQLRGPRQFFFNVDALVTKSKRPDSTTIGDDQAGPWDDPNDTTNNNNNNNNQPQLLPFQRQDLGRLTADPESGGIRGRWGFWNPDDSGLTISGFWQGKGTSSLFLGDPNVDINDPDTYLAIAGVPLMGPDVDTDGLPGATQPFDLYYKAVFETRFMGAGLDYYSGSLYERDAIKVRGLIGARYMKLKESFHLKAADSGQSYTIDPVTLRPDGDTTFVYDPFEAQMNSDVTTHLGGPEIGFRVDLGKKNFNIWTETKFGLLANQNKRTIQGENFAYYFALQSTDPLVDFDPGDADTSFNQNDDTTSVSPMFEQSIFARAALFSYIPGLKKIELLEEAVFQMGYTFILVGEVYRPGDIINWDAYPINPSLRDQKSSFYANQLSFGVEWTY